MRPNYYPFNCVKYSLCVKQNKMLVGCKDCENYKTCYYSFKTDYIKDKRKCNYVFNIFPDGSQEFVYYKESFLVTENTDKIIHKELTGLNNIQNSDLQDNFLELDEISKEYTRNFVKNEKGILIPVKENATIDNLLLCMEKSGNRAYDMSFGFAVSNDWKYFITLTFSPEEVNRYDDNAVKQLWKKWRERVTYHNPDAMILVFPERHKDGAIHFHGFLSNVNLTLTLATDKEGKQIYSKSGEIVFNINDWNFGWSTCCVLPKDNNKRKVANYCIKYVNKSGNIGYCQKRYYRTHNLLYKDKYCGYMELPQEIDELDKIMIAQGYDKVPKDKNKGIVSYRKI